jgi:hypothetical protein
MVRGAARASGPFESLGPGRVGVDARGRGHRHSSGWRTSGEHLGGNRWEWLGTPRGENVNNHGRFLPFRARRYPRLPALFGLDKAEVHPHFVRSDRRRPAPSPTADGTKLQVMARGDSHLRWRGQDSNLRRLSRVIYSHVPLTAREPRRERSEDSDQLCVEISGRPASISNSAYLGPPVHSDAGRIGRCA